MKKKLCYILVAVMLVITMLTGCGNKQLFDTTYTFDHAQIEMPDGTVVSGKVSSWRDYDDGDQLQIVINGKTYLTDSTRCVLWKD